MKAGVKQWQTCVSTAETMDTGRWTPTRASKRKALILLEVWNFILPASSQTSEKLCKAGMH
jgi:hypothetical protein